MSTWVQTFMSPASVGINNGIAHYDNSRFFVHYPAIIYVHFQYNYQYSDS